VTKALDPLRTVGAVPVATAQRPPAYRTSLVRKGAVTAELVAAWRDLADRAAEPNCLAGPDVVLPAMEHLDPHGRAGLLVVEREAALVALLPVLVPTRVPVRGVQLPVPVA